MDLSKYDFKRKSAPRARQADTRYSKTKLSKKTIIEGFSKIPNFIILDPALTCQDRSVFSVLCFHAFEKEWCNPSQKTISTEANVSERAVRNSLKKFKRMGYITWKGTLKSNRYVLIHKVQKS